MEVLHPKTVDEAVKMKKKYKNGSLYLSGGSDILRLNGEGKDDSVLIDVLPLLDGKIYKDKEDGMIHISSGATLENISKSKLVPSILREACLISPSFERRNSSTIGGNVGAKRSDSYLLSSLSVLESKLHVLTKDGEKILSVPEYVKGNGDGLILEFVVDGKRKGRVKHFSHSSESHNSLIAAESNGKYALSISSSPFLFGDSPDIYKKGKYVDDITGSGEYKRYLASIVFDSTKGGKK